MIPAARCLTSLALCALLIFAPVVSAQESVTPPPPPDATLQAWSQLAPEVQAYERFRYWTSFQPVALRDDPKLVDAYRAALIAAGTSAEQADTAIAIIRQQGERLEVERWNRILTAEKPRFNANPNTFLVQMMQGRKPGHALDVGMGQGRNAIYLASRVGRSPVSTLRHAPSRWRRRRRRRPACESRPRCRPTTRSTGARTGGI
jgi:hypothetical protein